MASNTLAPVGFSFTRNSLSSAGNYATTQGFIGNGYGTAIMVGDPVIINSSGLVAAVASGTPGTNVGFYGIFAGVLPYYDTVIQATAHGLNGAYLTTLSPASGFNVPCQVITDPFACFAVQTNYAGPFQQTWVGSNTSWLYSSVGNQNLYGNSAGRSGAYCDSNYFTTTNTLPFRVVGSWGVAGSPQDPANNNPWIEVRMNNPASLAATGI
jgi:hypothetical protein